MMGAREGLVLRAFLEGRTGFSVPEDRWASLAPKFLTRVAKSEFPTVEAYIRSLEEDRRGRSELQALFNVLPVRTTSFFRNPACFRALERDVLTRLVRPSGAATGQDCPATGPS